MFQALTDRIEALLPQTQCTKCGFQGCAPYAQALASDNAPINRCPPGGEEGIKKLAALLGKSIIPPDIRCGEHKPLHVALIAEEHCIGCTLCIQACPVDAIIGAPKRMHTVIAKDCTGCDLCVAPCPVDCIEMVQVEPQRVWTALDAKQARDRYQARQARLALKPETLRNESATAALVPTISSGTISDLGSKTTNSKQAAIAQALARARARRMET